MVTGKEAGDTGDRRNFGEERRSFLWNSCFKGYDSSAKNNSENTRRRGESNGCAAYFAKSNLPLRLLLATNSPSKKNLELEQNVPH